GELVLDLVVGGDDGDLLLLGDLAQLLHLQALVDQREQRLLLELRDRLLLRVDAGGGDQEPHELGQVVGRDAVVVVDVRHGFLQRRSDQLGRGGWRGGEGGRGRRRRGCGRRRGLALGQRARSGGQQRRCDHCAATHQARDVTRA